MIDSPSPVAPALEPALIESLGEALASALATKGYTSLTPVQKSVLDPALVGRDLRISSQTGSGKTLAVGFVLRGELEGEPSKPGPVPQPRALLIAPTRELAKQVEGELRWLYAPQKIGVVAVTGGSSYRDERRALSRGPGIVVGTPGRLLDHENRGSIDVSAVRAVVLDEADRMLDLGFREELEAILAALPAEHRTHLVSATFAREVKALADRIQKGSVSVQGTPLGTANVDIDHVIYLVPPAQRVDALVNLLLSRPDERTLIFTRTRAEVADVTRELDMAGFAADSLSGEMQQDARNRALDGFRRGNTRVLVATDVAGRGIDVQDVTQVIQLDPPTDADTYTHRSGRTGRAGKKGTSAVLVSPSSYRRTVALLGRAGVKFRTDPVPTAESIRAAEDERWFADLTRDVEGEVPARIRAQVERLMASGLVELALGRLLGRAPESNVEPREVTPLSAGPARGATPMRGRPQREQAPQREYAFKRDHAPRRDHAPEREQSPQREYGFKPNNAPQRDYGFKPHNAPQRDNGFKSNDAPEREHAFKRPQVVEPVRAVREGYPAPFRKPAERPAMNDTQGQGQAEWVPFRVTWGQEQGADARRLVAMLCRRGRIRGGDIGAIRVHQSSSSVDIAGRVASVFSQAASVSDPRDPLVSIVPLESSFEQPRGR